MKLVCEGFHELWHKGDIQMWQYSWLEIQVAQLWQRDRAMHAAVQ